MGRRWTVIGSGLMCVVLALVVIYSNRRTFNSPIAILVFAAVGLLALGLRLRLRMPGEGSIHMPLGFNLLGILFALGALAEDSLHFHKNLAPVLALLAIGCFGVSSAWVLQGLRKRGNPPSERPTDR